MDKGKIRMISYIALLTTAPLLIFFPSRRTLGAYSSLALEEEPLFAFLVGDGMVVRWSVVVGYGERVVEKVDVCLIHKKKKRGGNSHFI
jgi:hypothetical protein